MAAPEPAPVPWASLPVLADRASLLGMSFGSASLLLLLGLNAWLSKSKKTPWIPGDSLVLGALSLELLGLVSQPVLDISDRQELDTDSVHKHFYEIHDNQFLIISARVVICVFIANLLPDVARARDRKVWSNLLALAISATVLLVHLSYESYIIAIEYWIGRRKAQWDYAVLLYQLSNMIIFASIVLLVLLLGCAALASKSIHEVVAHRIPVMCCRSEYQNTQSAVSWEEVEGQAVRSWIMARTYQPQYIIARSVLSSSIGFLVTICVAFCFASSLLGWMTMNDLVIPEDRVDWWRRIVVGMQWIFILLGWVTVFWRWFTAVVFYPKRMGKGKEALSLKKYFHVEEFWKNALVELQEEFKESDVESLESLSLLKSFLLEFVKRLRLYKLLHILLYEQIFLVLMSKTCWLISEMAFSNQYTRRLLLGQVPHDFSMLCNLHSDGPLEETRNADYLKYSEAVMYMPGEYPAGVWIANLKPIQEMTAQFKKGESCGKNSKSLNSLLEKIPQGTNSIDLFAISHERKPEVERDFHVGKISSKMTTVSLLTIIMELSAFYEENGRSSACPSNDVVKQHIQACCEAWQIMELVDNSDSEAALVSKQADRLFHRLKESCEWLGCALPLNKSNARTFEAAKEAVQRLAAIGKQKANGGCISSTGYDSKNWKAIIAGNNLYKVCESIQNRSNNKKEMLNVIEISLADVIGSCMLKVGEIIMDRCKLWAEAFMEEKLRDALYEAGRAKGVMQMLQSNFGRPLKYERIHSY